MDVKKTQIYKKKIKVFEIKALFRICKISSFFSYLK